VCSLMTITLEFGHFSFHGKLSYLFKTLFFNFITNVKKLFKTHFKCSFFIRTIYMLSLEHISKLDLSTLTHLCKTF